MIDTGQMSYSQYVLPAIVVQAMLFGALTTTDRAADARASGMSVRLRTLPISPYAGLSARMSYSAIRGTLALIASVIGAYLLGFRFTTGSGPSNESGDAWLPLLATVVGVAGLAAVFVPYAARGYRNAAEVGNVGD